MRERRDVDRALTEKGLPSEGQRTPASSTADTPRDPVEEADIESFPASDPPAWDGADPQSAEPPHQP